MRPLPPLPKAARADSYTKAEALLICWKPEGKTHQTFKDQRDKLGYELGGYNFGVETFELEPPTPYRKLSRRLQDFVQHDNPDTLLIVYYGGHGAKNEDDQLIWLRFVYQNTNKGSCIVQAKTSTCLVVMSQDSPARFGGFPKSIGVLFKPFSYTNAPLRFSSCLTAAMPEHQFTGSRVLALLWHLEPPVSTI